MPALAIACVVSVWIERRTLLPGLWRIFYQIVANLATKRVAATAIGFTSIFSYASTLVSGWGLGWLVQHHGWNAALAGLTDAAGLGAFMFALAWPAKAHAYDIVGRTES